MLKNSHHKYGHSLTLCTQNVATLSCYNTDIHEPILIVFGRNVTKKVCNQKVLYFSTSSN